MGQNKNSESADNVLDTLIAQRVYDIINLLHYQVVTNLGLSAGLQMDWIEYDGINGWNRMWDGWRNQVNGNVEVAVAKNI
jgi:hypothetical protein